MSSRSVVAIDSDKMKKVCGLSERQNEIKEDAEIQNAWC